MLMHEIAELESLCRELAEPRVPLEYSLRIRIERALFNAVLLIARRTCDYDLTGFTFADLECLDAAAERAQIAPGDRDVMHGGFEVAACVRVLFSSNPYEQKELRGGDGGESGDNTRVLSSQIHRWCDKVRVYAERSAGPAAVQRRGKA